MRFCVPLMVLVLVHIDIFFIFDFMLVRNVSVRVVTGCTFVHLIAGIRISLSSWRDVGGGQTSIEVQGCREVAQCRPRPKWDFMCHRGYQVQGIIHYCRENLQRALYRHSHNFRKKRSLRQAQLHRISQ